MYDKKSRQKSKQKRQKHDQQNLAAILVTMVNHTAVAAELAEAGDEHGGGGHGHASSDPDSVSANLVQLLDDEGCLGSKPSFWHAAEFELYSSRPC